MTNSCGADQTAKDTCAQASAAADTQTAKTGAQADAFNAVFGITTDFAAVPEVDDQGNTISGTGATATSAVNVAAATTTAADASATSDEVDPCAGVDDTDTATDAATATTDALTAVASSTAAASSIGDFGSCSVPQIEFATGFDNRKETSFQPVDKS